MFYSYIPIFTMDSKHEPLYQCESLESSLDTLLEKHEYYGPVTPRKTFWSRTRNTIIINGILIVFYSIVCFLVLKHASDKLKDYNASLIESPARPAMKSVQSRFYHTDDGGMDYYFADPPSPEIDSHWFALSNFSTFRFSEDQMHRWGRSGEGVRLTDGSGYMGTLNVFHEMHCLRRVYMYIHRDHYYGDLNLTEYEQHMSLRHIMHCMESLRRGVQCRADISPVTYLWEPDWKIPGANWTSPHECKDWSNFMDWAKDNSFSPFEPGLVVHPTLGPAYEGELETASKLGVKLDKQQINHHNHG